MYNLPSSVKAHMRRPEQTFLTMNKAAVYRVWRVVPGSALCMLLRARSLTATISRVPVLRSLYPLHTACKGNQ